VPLSERTIEALKQKADESIRARRRVDRDEISASWFGADRKNPEDPSRYIIFVVRDWECL
jgi:hypothetical protein